MTAPTAAPGVARTRARAGEDRPARHTWIGDRAALVAFGAFVAVAFPLIIFELGAYRWFDRDDWMFLTGREARSLDDLFRPHSDVHWSTVPILGFRGLWSLFGIRTYVPYQAVVVALHLSAAVLLRVAMRRAQVQPWLATAAAGIGSFAGTAVGSRLHAADPDRVVLIAAGATAGITVFAALFYSFAMAVVVALVAAVTNALGKVSLDAIIQREVPERLRASAFARSETMLQLAWVVGGALGIALPPTGWLGFTVAAALLVLAVGLVLWSLHRSRRPPPLPAQPAWPSDAPTDPLGQRWS